MTYTIHPLGDSAALIDFQIENEETLIFTLSSLSKVLSQLQHAAIIEAVPAYKTVTVHYNPLKIDSDFPFQFIEDLLTTEIDRLQLSEGSRRDDIITIPVLYGDDAGPDLTFIAEHHGISEEKVIQIHSRPVYSIAFLGFSPGFPFLKGMDPSIAVPRRKTPRIRIEAGSVGIAGSQTGVYPISSPGGWQIIGKTPLKLFDPDKTDKPALFSQGDRIKFTPISKAEFERLEES